MSNFPITTSGIAKIKKELVNLKTIERPNIVKAIAEAREHGDLKENAEYHSARDKQSFIEGRILDLEDKIARAQIIDPTQITDTKVKFSATVTLFDVENDNEITYQIVSEYEADINNNLISITSPIAKGLIGKEAEDEVSISTPKGEREYVLVKVEYK